MIQNINIQDVPLNELPLNWHRIVIINLVSMQHVDTSQGSLRISGTWCWAPGTSKVPGTR